MKLWSKYCWIGIIFFVFLTNNSILVRADEARNDKNIVKVSKDKVWSIKFNKPIDIGSLEMEYIYVLDILGEKVKDVYIEIKDSKTIVVKNREDYKEGQLYKLVVENRFSSIDDELLKEGINMLFEIDGDDGDSDADFKVAKVEKYGQKMLYIEFKSEIDSKAEIPLFYELINGDDKTLKGSYDNLKIKKVSNSNKAIIVEMIDGDFELEGLCFIRISKELKDRYGNRYNDGKNQWEKIDMDRKDERFDIVSAEFQGDKIIKVTFNRELYPYENFNTAYVEVKDKDNDELGIDDIKIIKDYMLINLDKAIEDDGLFTVEVKSIKDVTEINKIKNKKFQFELDGIRDNFLKFEANVLNEHMIEIILETKIDEDSIDEKFSYMLKEVNKERGMSVPTKIYHDENEPNRVVLYYERLLRKDTEYYMILSEDIRNIFGEKYGLDSKRKVKGTSKKYEFKVEGVSRSSKSIDITLTRELIREKWYLDNDRYTLTSDDGYGRRITLECESAKFIDDKTLRLSFPGMRKDEKYKIVFERLHGYFGGVVESKEGIAITD